MSSPGLDEFFAAAPRPQGTGLRLMLSIARRPRGMRLLRRLPPAEQLTYGILAMDHFEDPAVSASLGWDAAAVAERGRALRRAEGRP